MPFRKALSRTNENYIFRLPSPILFLLNPKSCVPEKRTMTSHHLGQQLLLNPLKSLVLAHESKKTPSKKTAATPDLLGNVALVKPFTFPASPYEYKVTALKECPTPEALQHCDTPDKAADYWRMHVATNPYFNPEVECFAVLLLNVRRRVKGHQIVSTGIMDSILVHPREVFRLAIAASAAALVLTHNHPSGDPTPSEGDIKVTPRPDARRPTP